MKALKTVAVALGITLGALIIIPLVVLAGLFVWLKVTEESDEEALELEPETVCVGDGAVRYRSLLEEAGAEVPPRGSDLHVPRAHLHVGLARNFEPAELVEPIYLRVPDAERAAAR
jgi:hypothetical protein